MDLSIHLDNGQAAVNNQGAIIFNGTDHRPDGDASEYINLID